MKELLKSDSICESYAQMKKVTVTHLYVQTIHCGESVLWGKSVRPS